jgi:hypothetical protein
MDSKLAPLNMYHGILYADRLSKDEQLLIRSLLRETKNGGRLKLTFTFCFMERTHKPFHLDK